MKRLPKNGYKANEEIAMTDSRICRSLVTITVASLLGACSGSQLPENQMVSSAAKFSHHQLFSYTGQEQSFTVPSGVTTVGVSADGASGGGTGGGNGGRVKAIVPVTSGDVLAIFVGGEGKKHGGFNGGGNRGRSYFRPGSGGGGASDVRQGGNKIGDRIVVAGGGGGVGGFGAYGYGEKGGAGGGDTGGIGICLGAFNGGSGGGGTQAAGGAGGPGGTGNQGSGTAGENGTQKHGGAGAGAMSKDSYVTGGGGGGGGYYGGGGGGTGGMGTSGDGCGGSGGGGSSYVERSARTIKNLQGVNTGNGEVVVFW
ncbi:MAG TPA: hypothetical protein VHT92_00750 [Candidatus Cybelea sp.]|nr:hypothetical protein [Candidatus Cybelea sp.]